MMSARACIAEAEGRQIGMADAMKTTGAAQAGKVWFITGTSTGFGRLLADEVLKAGGRVIATARKVEQIADLTQTYPETARVFALDVTKPEQIEAVAKDAIAAFGPGRCAGEQRRLRDCRRD